MEDKEVVRLTAILSALMVIHLTLVHHCVDEAKIRKYIILEPVNIQKNFPIQDKACCKIQLEYINFFF